MSLIFAMHLRKKDCRPRKIGSAIKYYIETTFTLLAPPPLKLCSLCYVLTSPMYFIILLEFEFLLLVSSILFDSTLTFG